MTTNLKTLHETDFVAWSEQMAQLMRDRRYDQVDWENVIEEMESLGRHDRRALSSQLIRVMMHLLKWQYQSERRTGSWRSTITEGRIQIHDLIEESPSLKRYLDQVFTACYSKSRRLAADETGLSQVAFPSQCPYEIEQILDLDFLP
jgi:hypothetical protein